MKQLQRIGLEWCYLNEMVVAPKDADGNYTMDGDDDDNDAVEDDADEQGEEIDWLRILRQQYPDCRLTNLNNRIVRYATQGHPPHQDLVLPQYWRPL